MTKIEKIATKKSTKATKVSKADTAAKKAGGRARRLEKIEKAPPFVQDMIIENAEKAARENGSNFVTVKLLEELQAKQQGGNAPAGGK